MFSVILLKIKDVHHAPVSNYRRIQIILLLFLTEERIRGKIYNNNLDVQFVSDGYLTL